MPDDRPVPPPRLALLQARAADVAVIFRRGPGKQVELVRWDVRTDAFERGHWFKGRLFHRRSDLSPDGRYLVYFASKISGRTLADRAYTSTWTAVSRPPWLTALALWPKGDHWAGGGLFDDDRTLMLNHPPHQGEPHPDHRPKKGLRVTANPRAHGEDDPIYSARLTRDGWAVARALEMEFGGYDVGYVTRVPELRVRAHPGGLPLRVAMERSLQKYRYREAFRVEGADGGEAAPLPLGAEWADWDRGGRLVALAGGRVQAAPVSPEGRVGPLETLIDLGDDRFEARRSPPAARRW
ncbi:MAG TPA: hypothetical protein VKA84_04965 [Gemmatimonadaceae bacterium]|nr:hypothetical protein [Gemmatimonadaceae bacterium]